MWKIAVGFVAFAALALFIIMQAGDKVDMRGESAAHETDRACGTGGEVRPGTRGVRPPQNRTALRMERGRL